ncbi:hypothetical protein, partial [Methylophaga muralis]|uniref:hypothetical protein n=1 Tax=Methylophaga muralis TaxID=291169 RepID=UPI003CCC03E2
MAENKDVKQHFHFRAVATSESYTSPSTGGGKKPLIPKQDRQKHGANLMQNLSQVRSDFENKILSQELEHLTSPIGIQVEFKSFPDIDLAVESLADARHGIELLNVVQRADKTYATIFVPEGKLDTFELKIEDYLQEKKSRVGHPLDNRKLIDTIQDFRTAVLDSLWT